MDVAYAADDLVDELEYGALQQRAEEMAEASANQTTAGGLNLSVFRGFQTGESDAVNQPLIPSQVSGESSVTTSGGSAANQAGGGSSLPVSDSTGAGDEGEVKQTNGATGKQGSNKRSSGSSLTLCCCFHGRDGLPDPTIGASSNSIRDPEQTETRPSKGSLLTVFKPLRSPIGKIFKWRPKEEVHHQAGDDDMDQKIGSPDTSPDDANKNHFYQGKDYLSSTQNNANVEADGVAMTEASGSDSTHRDDEGITDQVTDSKLQEISHEKVISKGSRRLWSN